MPSVTCEPGQPAVNVDFHDPAAPASVATVRETVRIRRLQGLLLRLAAGPAVPLTHTPFVLGRGADCDLVVPDLTVSRRHAEIRHAPGDGLEIRDLGSRNGTFVNGEPIRAHWLEDGDEITIGKHSISFQNPRRQAPIEAPAPSIVETMPMDTAAFRELLRRNRRPLPRRPGGEPGPFPLLTVLRGPRREVRLTDRPFRIGGDPSADLVLRGWFVPPVAAVINREEDGWHLTPAARWPRVRVNGEALRAPRRLLRLDVITIGRLALQYRHPA